MGQYFEIAGATNFKRKKYKATAENVGTYVITLSTEAKQKLVDLEEFVEGVELNDLEFVNAIKQKSNLRNWRVAFEVANRTTIIVGKIISVIWQTIESVEQCIATCLLSNGAYVVLTISNGETLSATLSSSGLVGGNGKVITYSNVEFNASGVANLETSLEDFETIVGLDNVLVVVELLSGETLQLYRTKFEEDSAKFIGQVINENGEFTSQLYALNYSLSGESVVSVLYEIELFEPNVEIPSGVEPQKLVTFKALNDYFELGSGIEAVVDDNNKTIDLIIG